ncbi:MAG TPA: dTDP-4-dehydrorhamnose reductase [Burkholderiaceae bacterium]|nr:dTDP-4-dehydrorhamnose reductase [Burkholderiaceae bacterium]
MKLLVTGAAGQVGWELARALQPLSEVVAVDRSQLDLADGDALRAFVRGGAFDVIVNAAAYTAVDQAEKDEALAAAVNARAPAILAEEGRRAGALLVHYSTDYVFDGEASRPYREDDATAPLNAYGRTKLEGERLIAAAGGDWLVLRTEWVYGSRGRNFLRTMLRLAAERDRLTVVDDQFGAPTSARLLADASAQIITRALAERRAGRFASEVLHLTAGGSTSWHGFATAIIAGAGARGLPVRCTEVTGIPATQYPTPARRPVNSRLDLTRVRERFGIEPPPWQAGLALALDEVADPT